MPDINPYEPSKTDQPLKRKRLIRREIGVALILLLTPSAMVIAVGASCSASRFVPSSEAAISFGLPLAILTGLMVWAAIIDRSRAGDPSSRPSRTGLFLGTPVAVAGAGVIAFGLAAVMILACNSLPAYEAAMRTAPWIFWLVTGMTLLAMLLLAWRAGR